MIPQSYTLKNGQSLILREAQPNDAIKLIAHVNTMSHESSFTTISPGEFDMSVEDETRFLQDCLAADTQLYLIALIDEHIVGALHFATGKRARVRHSGEFGLSVLKAYWGLGIGSLLLEALISWAKANPVIKKINLRVRTDNLRALKLYEKKGFHSEGILKAEIYHDTHYYDLYSMALFV